MGKRVHILLGPKWHPRLQQSHFLHSLKLGETLDHCLQHLRGWECHPRLRYQLFKRGSKRIYRETKTKNDMGYTNDKSKKEITRKSESEVLLSKEILPSRAAWGVIPVASKDACSAHAHAALSLSLSHSQVSRSRFPPLSLQIMHWFHEITVPLFDFSSVSNEVRLDFRGLVLVDVDIYCSDLY